uniref:SET domain-containing protein n=1 Tax=viral metagenome TaxID=1070528 RepID=A0A6C0E0P2_9ZZZZ
MKRYRSPIKEYRRSQFTTTARPKSPSPKRKDFPNKVKLHNDGVSRCTYIHPLTGKRCRNKLEMYPQFCEMHTIEIENVYISKSNIENAGNGLFAGKKGFKKGTIIGIYSYPWNKVSLGNVQNRCGENSECWAYIFCEHGNERNTKCYDGLDIRSTLMRNINDAHNSGQRNNSYFDVIRGTVYVVASRNIKPGKEILVSYGKNYFS